MLQKPRAGKVGRAQERWRPSGSRCLQVSYSAFLCHVSCPFISADLLLCRLLILAFHNLCYALPWPFFLAPHSGELYSWLSPVPGFCQVITFGMNGGMNKWMDDSMAFQCKCPSSPNYMLSVVVQNFMREDLMGSVCPIWWVFTPGPVVCCQRVWLLSTNMTTHKDGGWSHLQNKDGGFSKYVYYSYQTNISFLEICLSSIHVYSKHDNLILKGLPVQLRKWFEGVHLFLSSSKNGFPCWWS